MSPGGQLRHSMFCKKVKLMRATDQFHPVHFVEYDSFHGIHGQGERLTKFQLRAAAGRSKSETAKNIQIKNR